MSYLLRFIGFATICALGVTLRAADGKPFDPEQEKFFETQVRPVLVQRCYSCHGSEKQESSLRLDSRAALLAGGASGEKMVALGDPDQSLLVKAVRHVGDIHMPPETKLPDSEIASLATWVKMGLPWPKSESVAPATAAERAVKDRASHWAYQPVVPPGLPSATNPLEDRNPIDRFVASKLNASGLAFSPAADARTQIRRATFDLHGLPPTPEEVDAFVEDSAPDAQSRLLDRLLASPRYGERWGRHWLDVARYGDTKGYAFANERRYPYAYTYRDYVIESFNRDLPYDQFVTEQLAADRLPARDDNRYLAALGFLTTGRKFNNAHDDIDDKIDVVGRGLLGLTVACARCHDHKYDAIPADDYYSLYGVFASCREPEDLPLLGTPAKTAEYRVFEQELGKLQADVTAFQNKKHADFLDQARKSSADYLARVIANQPDELLSKLPFLSLGRGDLRPRLVERWKRTMQKQVRADHPVFGPWHELVGLSDSNEPGNSFAERAGPIQARFQQLPSGIAPGQLNPLVKVALAEPLTAKTDLARVYGKLFSDAYAAWQQAGGNAEGEAKLDESVRQLTQLLLGAGSPTDVGRGDVREYLNRAERNEYNELDKKVKSFQATSPNAPPRAMIVAENPQPHNPQVFIRGNFARPGKAVPRQFLNVLSASERIPFGDAGGRLDLARSIVSLDNPLTRRVLANRVWMNHFGEPLVATPSDFGVRSEVPVQRDTLDYLAWTLAEDGWSVKALHRRIMSSAVYNQSSTDRPDCRANDPENRLYWRMNRRRLEFESLRDTVLAVSGQLDSTMSGRPVELTKAPYPRRRTVYGYIDRQDLPNLLRVFDFASPDQSSERRPRTTVPQQSLFLMNSEFVIGKAKSLAERSEIQSAADTTARIAALYRIALQRPPAPAEAELATQFVDAITAAPGDGAKLNPWEQLAQLVLLTNELSYVD